MGVREAVWLVDVQLSCVRAVQRWLEVFGEEISCVLFSVDSPNPHQAIDVILTDCVVSDVD